MRFLAAFFVLFALSYVNGYILLRRIKTKHASTWGALGRPSLWQSNLARPSRNLVKFIWFFEFRRLQDTTLTMQCLAAMFLDIGAVITAIGYWVSA